MSEVQLMELSRTECLALLGTGRIGRLVFTAHALPAAHPVSYFLDDEEVIFRTGADSLLVAAAHHRVVAFQTDSIDDTHHTGWSVCGVGEAYEVVDPRRLVEINALAPAMWAPHVSAHTVCIPLQQLTGHQLVLTSGIS